MSEQPPTTVDTLYLDAEHFALTAEARPPWEPRATVVPTGRPFPGLIPREDAAGHGESTGPVRPDEEPTA